MAKSSSSSEALSKIMRDKLNGSPELQAKQARLIELLNSGRNPELLKVLSDLLVGPDPHALPSVPDPIHPAESRRVDEKGKLPKSSKAAPDK